MRLRIYTGTDRMPGHAGRTFARTMRLAAIDFHHHSEATKHGT